MTWPSHSRSHHALHSICLSGTGRTSKSRVIENLNNSDTVEMFSKTSVNGTFASKGQISRLIGHKAQIQNGLLLKELNSPSCR